MSRLAVNASEGCPLALTCARVGPHEHAICDYCGAEDFTNPRCEVCRTLSPAWRSKQAIEWAMDRIFGKTS